VARTKRAARVAAPLTITVSSTADVYVKGDAYGELLSKGAEDIKSGAGQ